MTSLDIFYSIVNWLAVILLIIAFIHFLKSHKKTGDWCLGFFLAALLFNTLWMFVKNIAHGLALNDSLLNTLDVIGVLVSLSGYVSLFLYGRARLSKS